MSQANGIKLKLMVVDDEPDNLDLLYRTFRREFRVFKADSGLNALQVLAEEGEMAVIISDQRMPQMNGTEFLSKTVDQFPETIRILLTGYTDVEDLVDAINSGKVFKYITKPWNPENLKSVVQQAADTYKVLKQRTNELRRTLQRESLVNAVMTAIRESLDYSSMMQTIVKSLGSNFDASYCILRPIESDRFLPNAFSYQVDPALEVGDINSEASMQAVLSSRQPLLNQGEEQGKQYTELVVPLICQQQLLGILSLYQNNNNSSWSREDVQVIESVADQAALAISQAKLYQRIQEQAQQMRAELQVARQIQTNLLRQSWPDVEGVKVQACCYPAREVGGDFFEVYVHPSGDVWVAVGDVSGKGVPAALFMASAISVLRRELAQEVSPEPEAIIHNLNRSLSEDLSSTNCFITMVLARYTPSTKQLFYANAGHVFPIIWSEDLLAQQKAFPEQKFEPKDLKTRGIPLGILPTWKGAVGNVTLNTGDTLLLMSDGITEATITHALNISNSGSGSEPSIGSMLKQEGLWQILLQESGPLDLNKLLDRIHEHAEVQEDDQTILSLEVL